MCHADGVTAATYQGWRATRFIPELDGLRTLSVLLVLTAHSPGMLFKPLNGRLGVTIFFVISGLLITTLLLRERDEAGSVSLRGFYIRRACRIFPLYFLALLTFLLAIAAGLAEHAGDLPRRLLHFLTFTNEWAAPGTFGHSWSLGVEEKFYVAWPLMAFAVPMTNRRPGLVAGGLLTVTTVLGIWRPDDPLGFYSPILAGCLLGIALHHHRSFEYVMKLAAPAPAVLLLGLAVAALLASQDTGRVDVAFGITAAAAVPGLMLGAKPLRAWLRGSSMQFVGRRSYAIYLFHPLVGSAVALVVTRQDQAWPAIYLALTFAGSLIAADVLYRTVERPLIRLGHRVTRTDQPDRVAALPA